MCVCACVCVYPQAMKNYSREMNPIAFQFAYMALTINITNEYGLSNKVHH